MANTGNIFIDVKQQRVQLEWLVYFPAQNSIGFG